MRTPKRRAGPLSPDERRQSIIAAVTPLLLERGVLTTTREMAQAAGIAEGTIFRVFPDKVSLIYEAVRHSMEPEPVERALSEIDARAPLDVQLVAAARILIERMQIIVALITILRSMPEDEQSDHALRCPDFVQKSNQAIIDALAQLFARQKHRLRISPELAATALRSLIFAAAHPLFVGRKKLTVPEIVGLLMKGILKSATDETN